MDHLEELHIGFLYIYPVQGKLLPIHAAPFPRMLWMHKPSVRRTRHATPRVLQMFSRPRAYDADGVMTAGEASTIMRASQSSDGTRGFVT